MPRVSANERAATRRRLIEAGKREFADRGLAGARFDEISLAAGHAKGTIYNYFPSKEALFFTIVGEWCELLAEGFDPTQERSVRQQLRALAEVDVDIARKDPDLARVVVQQMPALTHRHREAVDDSIAEATELLIAVIDRGLASGELASPHDAPALARLFVGALSAIELEALLPSAPIGLDDVVDIVDRHFIAGLAVGR